MVIFIYSMRCRYCADIITIREPDEEYFKHEEKCKPDHFGHNGIPYEMYERTWGKEKRDAYEKMAEEYIKENFPGKEL